MVTSEGNITMASNITLWVIRKAILPSANMKNRKQGEVFSRIYQESCVIKPLFPLCEGNMTICTPEAGNIARGRLCVGG